MLDSPLPDCPPSLCTAVSVGGGAWIFDLDNTLYPAADSLFVQVSQRIRDYIGRFLDLDAEAAFRLQKDYFARYGTSLRGMMIEHGMDPAPYLAYVHDVDLAMIAPNPRLDAALGGLGGRKLVFTNASCDHAERVLERLGVARHFDAIFDIADGDYVPKPEPEPYAALVRRHAFDPTAAVMIDDIARNLLPAAALGMTTVWLRNDTDWGRTGAADGHVHHVVDDLIAWLETAAAAPASRRA